jgi:hypothetical protein
MALLPGRWHVVCDGGGIFTCPSEWETDCYTKRKATAAVRTRGFRRTRDGRWLCSECWAREQRFNNG